MSLFKTIINCMVALSLFVQSMFFVADANNATSTPTEIHLAISNQNLNALSPGDLINVFYGLTLANLILSGHNSNQNIDALGKLFFTPSLYNSYHQEQAMDAKSKGLGCLDMMPFVGAQDFPTGFSVNNAHFLNSTSAEVKVNLVYAEPTQITIHLIKTLDGWKIMDINYANHNSFRALLNRCLKQ